jgi:hypothetical protein
MLPDAGPVGSTEPPATSVVKRVEVAIRPAIVIQL